MHQLVKLDKDMAGGVIPPVSIFYAKQTPLIFLSHLKERLSGSVINFDVVDFDKFKSILSISFLGNSSIHLVNLSTLSATKKKPFIDYLKSYNGPNSIMIFTDEIKDFNSVIDLDVEKNTDPNSIFKFLNIFEKNSLKPILDKLILKDLSVDELLILYYYSTCLGSQRESFELKWLGKIIKSNSSLFDLSSHFFSKNRKKFFQLWTKVEGLYSDMFWISFWSEQIYRAHFYIMSRKNNDLDNAKRISYKLPFSFMQKDWRFIDCKALSEAHNDIYKLDYFLKNGTSNISLDLFYTRYFSPV